MTTTGQLGQEVSLKDVAPDDAVVRGIGLTVFGRVADSIFPLRQYFLDGLFVLLVMG